MNGICHNFMAVKDLQQQRKQHREGARGQGKKEGKGAVTATKAIGVLGATPPANAAGGTAKTAAAAAAAVPRDAPLCHG